MANAYPYRQIDLNVVTEQLTNTAGIEERPENNYVLSKSMYRIRQAGRIWGSLLIDTLIKWGFKQSCTDKRILLLRIESNFIVMFIVADDMILNYREMLIAF